MMRAALVFCTLVSLATAANAAPAKCPFAVVEVRESHTGEAVDDELARDRNTAVASNDLVAHVRIVDRRGYLVVQNSRTGEDSLFVCPYGMLPEWSPDGRYLSVDLWTERTRQGKLVVFESSSWKRVVDVELASATDVAWAPNSKRIASAGFGYDKPVMTLYAVTVPAGKVTVIDTTSVLSEIDFAWSPDSRWIVYARPTKLEPMGEPTESDLWIADAASGDTWCLIKATDHHESNPVWINDRTLQVDRIWWTGGQTETDWTNRQKRVVVVLKRVQ